MSARTNRVDAAEPRSVEPTRVRRRTSVAPTGARAVSLSDGASAQPAVSGAFVDSVDGTPDVAPGPSALASMVGAAGAELTALVPDFSAASEARISSSRAEP